MWNFKQLKAWQAARRLVVDVYAIADRLPQEERFGLASQLKRSANSIGANIAEGSGRPMPRDRAQFLGYAIASADETEHHLVVAIDLGFVPVTDGIDLTTRLDEIRRMLKALRHRSLNESR